MDEDRVRGAIELRDEDVTLSPEGSAEPWTYDAYGKHQSYFSFLTEVRRLNRERASVKSVDSKVRYFADCKNVGED